MRMDRGGASRRGRGIWTRRNVRRRKEKRREAKKPKLKEGRGRRQTQKGTSRKRSRDRFTCLSFIQTEDEVEEEKRHGKSEDQRRRQHFLLFIPKIEKKKKKRHKHFYTRWSRNRWNTWSKHRKQSSESTNAVGDRSSPFRRIIVVGFVVQNRPSEGGTEVNVSRLDFRRRLDPVRSVSSGLGPRHSKRQRRTHNFNRKTEIIIEPDGYEPRTSDEHGIKSVWS